jgi:hypothetical protein
MNAFQVTATLERVPPSMRADLEHLGDSLLDVLLDLDAVDPAVSVTFSESVVEVEITVEARTAADALARIGMSLLDQEDDEPDEWTVRRERVLAPA